MRTIVVSNRLPLVIESTPEGLTAHHASGGLVSAMEPVLQRRGGVWIGWPGTINAERRTPYALKLRVPQRRRIAFV